MKSFEDLYAQHPDMFEAAALEATSQAVRGSEPQERRGDDDLLPQASGLVQRRVGLDVSRIFEQVGLTSTLRMIPMTSRKPFFFL